MPRDERIANQLPICALSWHRQPVPLYAPVREGEFTMITAPIRVITIEREYGSRGGEFAHDLAGRLGWRLLDS